jgi:hypothetical protein
MMNLLPGISSNFSDDQPYSWSEAPFHPSTEKYKNARVCPDKLSKQKLKKNLVCPVSPKHQPGGTLPDMESTQVARKFLQKARSMTQPFFLALGYHKPHIPLKYPAFYKSKCSIHNTSTAVMINLSNNYIIPFYRVPSFRKCCNTKLEVSSLKTTYSCMESMVRY